MIALNEITRLNTALPLRARQTAMSLLACHAAYFEYSSPKDFCDDYGLSVTGIAHGDPSALQRLAALTGADFLELQKWSPVRVSERYFSINGQLLGTTKSPRVIQHGCPLCIEQQIAANPDLPLDVAVHQRAEDVLGYLHACPVHHVAIVTVRTATKPVKYVDAARNTGELLEALRDEPRRPLAPTECELYAYDRILGDPTGSPLLDKFSLITVDRVSRALGVDILRASPETLEDSKNERLCAAAGFLALKDGEDSLVPVLTRLRDSQWLKYDLSAKAIPTLIKNIRFAITAGEAEALADLIAHAAFKVFPYDEGDTLLDARCDKRYLHTLASASRAYPMAPRVMELFLENTPGLVVAGSLSEGKVLIDADRADELFAQRVPLVAMNQVCQAAGVKWEFIQELIDAGILQDETDEQLNDYPTLFSKPRVTAAIDALTANWRVVKTPGANRVPLHVAANKIRTTRVAFFKFFRNGKISVERVEGKAPLASILIDMDEAYAAFYGSEFSISAEEAGAMLRVNRDSLRRVVDAGHLTNLHQVAKEHGCRFGYRVDRREVDAFLERLAPLSEVADLLGRPGINSTHLSKLGLSPTIDMGERAQANCTATFYAREDVSRLLLAA